MSNGSPCPKSSSWSQRIRRKSQPFQIPPQLLEIQSETLQLPALFLHHLRRRAAHKALVHEFLLGTLEHSLNAIDFFLNSLTLSVEVDDSLKRNEDLSPVKHRTRRMHRFLPVHQSVNPRDPCQPLKVILILFHRLF